VIHSTAELADFMSRHDHVALMFSAGKDSAACLKLLRPWARKLTVIWANPGRPYPEVVAYMHEVRQSVPHFVEARGHMPQWNYLHGWPADQVPFEATPIGLRTGRDPRVIPLVSAVECKWANMWEPALWAVRASGASGVIKGEKLCDNPLPYPLETVSEGREYFRPLLRWSHSDVIDFLGDDLPPGYARGLTASLDCMTCTAFLSRNPQRLRELKELHPVAYAEVEPVLDYMRRSTAEHLHRLELIANNDEG
jgi:phosphoadenosine phosphosulfate reductase